jgi:accessory colonization factor AcfC
MSDFIEAMPDIDPQTVEPLYLRESAILVRPGNPNHISGVADLLKPGHSIPIVNGAGQQGLWEDVAGRLGDIGSVRAFRHNIARVAKNSAEAKAAWVEDKTLDAWLIWTIWQQTKSEAKQFFAFLIFAEGAAIFRKWGWIAPAK